MELVRIEKSNMEKETTLDDEDEKFYDAPDDVTLNKQNRHPKMNLLKAADEAVVAATLFLTDRYEAAMEISKPWMDTSIYHAVINAMLHFVGACFSFEPAYIENAIEVLKSAENLCNSLRHPTTMSNNAMTKIMIRPNYDSYTEEQIHAELIYAECLLARALLTFFQNDNFISFIRGGFRLRASYQIYKECQDILEHKTWQDNRLKEHFESGVNLGLGTFNLVLSSLPKRVLKLLEIIGFSGDRDTAIKMLNNGHEMPQAARGVFCTIMMFGYDSIIQYLIGQGTNDFTYVDKLLATLSQRYPNSTFTLFCAGRVANIKGKYNEAISLLRKAVELDVPWDKFKHISYFELYMCYLISGQYHNAMQAAEYLRKENNWSKSIYTYMKAAAMCMCSDLTDSQQQEKINLMTDVPNLTQRFAGKSLPPEKFFSKKAKRFVSQNNWLFLPVMELMYAFNYFMVIKGKVDILDQILVKIDEALENFKKSHKKNSPFYKDNYCLGLFLKGVCLAYMGSPLSAEEVFVEAYENIKKVTEDHFIESCVLLELGIIHYAEENFEQAVQYLNAAKKNAVFFTDYRIHSTLQEMEMKGVKTEISNTIKF